MILIYLILTPLIVSIDVFISPIDWFEKKESKYGSITYNQYQRTDNETEQILKAYRFYKVAEFSLKGKQTWRLDEWSKDNISIQEQLITSETKHSFPPKQAMFIIQDCIWRTSTTPILKDICMDMRARLKNRIQNIL
jgi:hypothetical protein